MITRKSRRHEIVSCFVTALLGKRALITKEHGWLCIAPTSAFLEV